MSASAPAAAKLLKPMAEYFRFFAMTERTQDDTAKRSRAAANKLALQSVVAVLAAVPVLVGLDGVIVGPGFLNLNQPWPIELDSHFRFLSGFFFATGIAWYSCILDIEKKTERFRLLAACTFTGGLARLASLALAGPPSAPHVGGLCVELLAVPALVAWQARVAKKNDALKALRRSGG